MGQIVAWILFILLFFVFSYRYGDAALEDFDIPDFNAMATQYSAPSTRANSEISLR